MGKMKELMIDRMNQEGDGIRLRQFALEASRALKVIVDHERSLDPESRNYWDEDIKLWSRLVTEIRKELGLCKKDSEQEEKSL